MTIARYSISRCDGKIFARANAISQLGDACSDRPRASLPATPFSAIPFVWQIQLVTS